MLRKGRPSNSTGSSGAGTTRGDGSGAEGSSNQAGAPLHAGVLEQQMGEAFYADVDKFLAMAPPSLLGQKKKSLARRDAPSQTRNRKPGRARNLSARATAQGRRRAKETPKRKVWLVASGSQLKHNADPHHKSWICSCCGRLLPTSTRWLLKMA